MASTSKPTTSPAESSGLSTFGSLARRAQCAACLVPKEVSRLLICSGCKDVKYCSRECQKGHWKFHGASCKREQVRLKNIAAAVQQGLAESATAVFTEHFDAIEKWVNLHFFLIEQCIATASQALPSMKTAASATKAKTKTKKPTSGLDLERDYVSIVLGKHSRSSLLIENTDGGSGGGTGSGDSDSDNPSTLFTVQSCTFLNIEETRDPDVKNVLESYRPMVQALTSALDHNPDTLGLMVMTVRYEMFPWASPVVLYRSRIVKGLDPSLAKDYLKYWVDSGFVFQKLDGQAKVEPGVMVKAKTKKRGGGWAWQAQGVDDENKRPFPIPKV